MRKFLILLLFPFIGMAQIINTPATRLEKELNGKAKALVERTYDVFQGNLKQKRLATENYYEFNKEGNTLQLEQKYSGITLRYDYVYNAEQKPLQVKILRMAHGGIQSSTGLYEYNNQGHLVTYRTMMEGSASPTQTYTFNKWDANGNPTEGLLVTPDSKAKVFQEFDKNNQRTLLKMITEGNPPTEMRISVRYDREGRVVERSIAEGNTKPDVMHYTYDKKGIPTGVNNQKFEHTFDKQGNWVTRIVFVNGYIVGFTEREIKY